MKHLFGIALLVTANLISSTNASAQNATEQATIPFSFTVGDKQLPSGTYTVSCIRPKVILFQNREKHASAISMTASAENISGASNRLIFHKYGDQYFLSEVRGSLGESALKLSTSKLEKNARAQEARMHSPQGTEVAMK
jgi:hypothetical protein